MLEQELNAINKVITTISEVNFDLIESNTSLKVFNSLFNDDKIKVISFIINSQSLGIINLMSNRKDVYIKNFGTFKIKKNRQLRNDILKELKLDKPTNEAKEIINERLRVELNKKISKKIENSLIDSKIETFLLNLIK